MRGFGGRALGLGALPHDHDRCYVWERVLRAAPISRARRRQWSPEGVNAWGWLGGHVRPNLAC